MASLFNGDITRWDDPAIAETNPGVELPDLPVVPVNRSDDSGTTENFTEYLAAAGGDAWPHEPSGAWPRSGTHSGQQNAGMLDRKSTRLNSSHVAISYAGFCLK